MESVRVAVGGFGPVGKAFIRLLAEKQNDILHRYGVNLTPAFVYGSTGYVEAESWSELLGSSCSHRWLRDIAGFEAVDGPSGICQRLQLGDYDVLVEATTSNLQSGQPAGDYVVSALTAGAHGVLLNKGPLICQWKRMKQVAKDTGRSLKVSGAAAAALPSIDVGRIALAGTNILRVRGILNGTSNYVLSAMAEDGSPWQEAVDKARRLGIAEADVTRDVSGYDTAVKLVIIANILLDGLWELKDVPIRGITNLSSEEVKATALMGNPIKLIGEACMEAGAWRLSVGPVRLGQSDVLANVRGAEKAICFDTDTMGGLCVSGGASSPKGAAAAALKDILHICGPSWLVSSVW